MVEIPILKLKLFSYQSHKQVFWNQTKNTKAAFTWLNAIQVDLDDITTKSIRLRLESDLNEKFEELKVGKLTNVTKYYRRSYITAKSYPLDL